MASSLSLLQISVNFEAVIARVRNSHVSIGGEREALGAVQRICRGVNVGQERPCAVKYLMHKKKKVFRVHIATNYNIKITPACFNLLCCKSKRCAADHLDSAVTPVSYNDVSIGIHGHTGGSIELAIAFTVRAELEQELPVGAVHLGQEARKV